MVQLDSSRIVETFKDVSGSIITSHVIVGVAGAAAAALAFWLLLNDVVKKKLADVPTSQARIVVTLTLIVSTAVFYFSAAFNHIAIDEHFGDWLLFLFGLSGADGLVYFAKRKTYVGEAPTPDREDLAAKLAPKTVVPAATKSVTPTASARASAPIAIADLSLVEAREPSKFDDESHDG